MPMSSPLPSPMALNKPQSPSMFKKRSTQSLAPTSAASYLSALSQADARARNGNPTSSPTSTPALSLSSSVTSSSEDTVLNEFELDNVDGLSLPMHPPTSEQVFTTVHSEFGHCANEEYRLTSQHTPGALVTGHVDQDPPYYILLSTYISYLILIVLGHIRDFIGKRLKSGAYKHLMPRDGYAPLNSDFDSFYTRRLKTRMDECFSQPVTGVAGRTILLLDRISPDYNHTQIFTGTRTRALNISSYNYLGFAQGRGGCADAVEESIKRYGISSCGSRLEGGSSDLHTASEALVARFVGMEDALISSMGFATNSTIIPALVGKGCLVISDELNHASIRFGVRISGAVVRMFKHNDMKSLENLLKEVISQGQPKTHRPWKKILIIVEGLYSMEGTLVNLPAIIELKKKYKSTLRLTVGDAYNHPGPAPSSSLPLWLSLPPSLLSGTEGDTRIRRLAFNSRYLHNGLIKLGFITYGHPASPIVPILLFNPGKMNMFHRMMKDRQTPIVVVVVAYPATPLVTSRVRFCVSAAHTKDDIDCVLRACDDIGDVLDLKHGIPKGERWTIEDVVSRAADVANL
ncbi:serine palmitoyltransferase 2 [Crucibulum laeve]|uniref:Serine palmitoyltransferase 2 n=1 Tax=Crucibulum laeve TaxID=68775 RepID=A0A5C3MGU6_9AGAR|nr:serine palmitoyltransferase 2 [Crucibulum laeve]